MIALLADLARAAEPSDVAVERRVDPRYPPGATGGARCIVRAEVSPSGRATTVETGGCADPFAAEARRAVGRWRWASFDGDPWLTVVAVDFARPGDPAPAAPEACEWHAAVRADGSVAAIDPPPAPACPVWFARAVDPSVLPLVPATCTVRFGDDKDAVDTADCPEPMRAVAAAILRTSFLAPSAQRTLVVVPSAGSAPAAPSDDSSKN